MPFKAGKSPSDVMVEINRILDSDMPKQAKAGLFSMYTVLAGTADYYAPMDTGATIKGRDYSTEIEPEKVTLTYGYYDTSYAAALHSPKPGGKMDGWKPVDPYEREWRQRSASQFIGSGTGGWNPNARQGWMNIAWEEEGDNAMKLFASTINK